MVCNYTCKTQTTWTKEDIDMAAVRHYKIPYTTLSYQWEGEWRTWKRSSNSTDTR